MWSDLTEQWRYVTGTDSTKKHDEWAFFFWRDQSSPGETVGRGQDPLCVDEGAAAEVSCVTVQTGLPGPRPLRSICTTDDPAVQRCLATNWRQTVEHYVSPAVRWWRCLVPGIRWLSHEECCPAIIRFHLALLVVFPGIRLTLSASCLMTQTVVGGTSTRCMRVCIVYLECCHSS